MPTGMLLNRYWPFALVLATDLALVAWLVISTEASVTNAPLASVTVPTRLASVIWLKPMDTASRMTSSANDGFFIFPVSYTHLRAHETPEHLVCRLLLEKKK